MHLLLYFLLILSIYNFLFPQLSCAAENVILFYWLSRCIIINVLILPFLARLDESPHQQQQVFTPLALDDQLITSEKQKKKLEKELKSKQKEMAKQEKKEKEREERDAKAKAKEEKKKEKLEKKSAARANMKANSVQGQPSMEDFR